MSEAQNQKKETDGGEEQGRVGDNVIKGVEDKANWAGRSETLKWR